MPHKAGFVNILGAPNVGKSTLINALTGENLAIVTPKAQTTRHRILGIINEEDYQIVLSDTPGLLAPKYELQTAMMDFIDEALEDADILLLVVESGADFPFDELLERIQKQNIPLILVINKVDLKDQAFLNNEMEEWEKRLPGARIIPASALHQFNIEAIRQSILDLLPESPPYYDKDALTDRNLRFFVSEIIREKILLLYQKEVPYSAEVVVEEFKEEPHLSRIRASVHVARESQRGIILGKGGKAIKRLGTEARRSIEDFLGTKVFLDLQVKVSKDWRNDPKMLKWFGYSRQ
jgi:GTP-binding protein Era